MFNHDSHVDDNGFERQVIRAAQRASFGLVVKNEWLAACAEILMKDFDPAKLIPGCSNGALRFSMYVPVQ
jgi:hypothetical protein